MYLVMQLSQQQLYFTMKKLNSDSLGYVTKEVLASRLQHWDSESRVVSGSRTWATSL